MPINRIFSELQKTLGEHGAKQVMLDYDDNGKVEAVSFVIPVNGKRLSVRLPARVDKANAVLQRQYQQGLLRERTTSAIYRRGNQKEMMEQAYRVAWKNILEWVQAQMALIEIEMAKIEEVFLPYMVTRTGETFFEATKRKNFQLESGNSVQEGEVIQL